MANFCIPKEQIDIVKNIITKAKDSNERIELFTKSFNKNVAKEMELLYERARLLKNQEVAFDNFFKNISGDKEFMKKVEGIKLKAKQNAEKRKEMIFNKDGTVNQDFLALKKQTKQDIMERLEELYDTKYGLSLNTEQQIKLANLIDEVKQLKTISEKAGATDKDILNYTRKLVQKQNYIKELINPSEVKGFKDTITDIISSTKMRFENKNYVEKILESAKLLFDVSTSAFYKSIQSSFDLSGTLRQGFKEFANNPKTWYKNFKNFVGIIKKIANTKAMDDYFNEWRAQTIARKIYNKAIDSDVALDVVEDFFPTTPLQKIPILGNLFKASDKAFTIMTQGQRLDRFEEIYNFLSQNGKKELTKEVEKDIGLLANSISGRGNMGQLERVGGLVNKIVYSGRFIKSAIDVFYLPFKPSLSKEVRIEAMKSSAKIISLIGGLMGTASLFTDVEYNPLSSKFGKARVPGTNKWVDLTGGIGSYITLASRGIKMKTKSATTGRISKLNTGEYGSQTYFDVLASFISNKLAPIPSTLVQYAKGKMYNGEKPTIPKSVLNLITPIWVGNTFDALNSNDEDKAMTFIAIVADGLGLSATDYSKKMK